MVARASGLDEKAIRQPMLFDPAPSAMRITTKFPEPTTLLMRRMQTSRTPRERRTVPQHVFDCWDGIARRIDRTRQVALFTDFDGTLTPIRKNPNEVELSPRVRDLLGGIAKSGVLVGIVSGRNVDDVRKRVGLKRIWYVGAHGFFLRDPQNHAISLVKRDQKVRMRKAIRQIGREIRGARGLRLETKIASVALHYREASARSRRIGRMAVAKAMQRDPKLSLLESKKIWGLLPDDRSDKWSAIQFIMNRECRRNSRETCLPIFIGDDATDERVFKRMRGVSVVVGKKSDTAARFWLRSPGEVRQFLERFLATRAMRKEP